MLEIIMTIFSELLGYFRLTRGLEFMSVVVVLMLLSSPGVVATILATGTLTGSIAFKRDKGKS